MEDSELDPSVLGTQDYWQKAYTKEIENYEEHGDTGDVWFGEDSADRVISWICDCGVERDTAIIDLGEAIKIFVFFVVEIEEVSIFFLLYLE